MTLRLNKLICLSVFLKSLIFCWGTIRSNRIAFKVVFSFLILAGFTNTPTFNQNQPVTNVNKAEYDDLLTKCMWARNEVVQYWAKAIKDGVQQVRGEYDLYIAQIKGNL